MCLVLGIVCGLPKILTAVELFDAEEGKIQTVDGIVPQYPD